MPGLLALLVTLNVLGAALACQPSYTACQPSGATGSSLPAIGTALAPLYMDLLFSIKNVPPPTRQDAAVLDRRDATEICCADGTACLNLANFDIPFCYDRFTTNFFLADASTGTLDDGTLNLADGPQVDMLEGNYTLGGGRTSGNIYGTSAPPAASTLPIPTPYTSAGIGGAIPLTDLAGIETVTTTIPGTVIPASTVQGGAGVATVFGGATTVVAEETTMDGSVMLMTATMVVGGTTEALTEGTTFPGTTIAPTTVTFTTAMPKASNSSTSDGPTLRAGTFFGIGLCLLSCLALM